MDIVERLLPLTKSLLFLAVLMSLSSNVCSQKNDTVFLINGDRITGEFKKYDLGILSLKTDAMGTISLEYDKINTIYSSKYFEIITRDGFTYYGTFQRCAVMGTVAIALANDTLVKPITGIVKVTPIKNIFWKKFSGSVDLGLSYYKSTQIFQYNFSTTLNYRSRKNLISFSLSSLSTLQELQDSLDKSVKNDISLGVDRFFSAKWWGGIKGKVQQNTELNLDHRYQLGLGAGYDIVHTNPVRLYVLAGLLANQEQPFDTTTVSRNMEGLISAKFIWLQYRHPKINISTNIDFFPSITISDRYRLEYDLSAKYEILKDLYLNLTFYDNFDSKPTGGEGALNDWGVIFSVGYTF